MKIAALLLASALALGVASAQTPTPIVVPAVTAAPTTPVVPAIQPAAAARTPLEAMQALKAANEEVLKKQAATLQRLDELQKAVEQLKIYSKRG